MKIFYFLIVFFAMPSIALVDVKPHDYFVSVTNVVYKDNQDALQIISQIFIDDFETLLQKRYDQAITLDSNGDTTMTDTYIKRYIKDKFQVSINGKPVIFTFLGKEYKDDIMYCYLEVENVLDLKTIEITNQMLFDIFSEQQNMIRIKALGENRSFLLLPNNDTCVLNFN